MVEIQRNQNVVICGLLPCDQLLATVADVVEIHPIICGLLVTLLHSRQNGVDKWSINRSWL